MSMSHDVRLVAVSSSSTGMPLMYIAQIGLLQLPLAYLFLSASLCLSSGVHLDLQCVWCIAGELIEKRQVPTTL